MRYTCVDADCQGVTAFIMSLFMVFICNRGNDDVSFMECISISGVGITLIITDISTVRYVNYVRHIDHTI